MKTYPTKILLFVTAILFLTSCSKESKLPTPDFTFQNSQEAPATIEFTNLSENADSYFWEFGNGGYSREENPTRIFHLPGRYTVSLKAKNEEGSVKKEATIHILGTTYRVWNRLSYRIYGVIGFYDMGSVVSDLMNLGSIGANESSSSIITERSQITIGIQISETEYFIISTPFLLDKDTENVLEIHEYVNGYVVEWDPWGNNEE